MPEINDTVKIKKTISKKSYFIYQEYSKASPYMVCPCTLKDNVVTVKKIIPSDEGFIALCLYRESKLTILYVEDLEEIND